MAINFPDSPGIGSVYTDATSGFSYEWTGTLWKSYSANTVTNIEILDDISGSFDGIETTFNLTVSGSAVTPVNSQQIEIILGGIQQAPGVDYTISGSTVIFTTEPVGGLTFSGKLLGTALSLNTIADGSSGSGLIGVSTNFVSAIGIQSGGTVIGAGITQLNFVGLNSVSQSANGTVNIDYIQGDTGATLSAGSGSQRVVLTSLTSGKMTTAATDAQLTYNSTTDTLTVGNVSIGGTLTYEDVTNVDSVGLITARSGIICNGAGIGLSVTEGGARITGVCSATSFNTTSDIKLKDNITTVDNALEVANQLRGVRFNWKESGGGDYGVIAQELEEVLPELVSQGDPKSVNYNGIIGVLIEAIKDLTEKVDRLERNL